MNGKRVPGPERGLATSALLAKYRVSSLVVQRRREAFHLSGSPQHHLPSVLDVRLLNGYWRNDPSGGGSERSGARVSAVLFRQKVLPWWISKAFPQLRPCAGRALRESTRSSSQEHAIVFDFVSQQSEQFQVSDVFDDDRRRNVRDVLVRADFRLLDRRTEPVSRRDGSPGWLFGPLVVVQQRQ
jgi:hypothetical protein